MHYGTCYLDTLISCFFSLVPALDSHPQQSDKIYRLDSQAIALPGTGFGLIF